MARGSCEARLNRLEEAARFYYWLRTKRWLQAMSKDELDAYIESDGDIPNPLPDPPPGSVPVDHVNLKDLRKLCKNDERFLARTKSAPAINSGRNG